MPKSKSQLIIEDIGLLSDFVEKCGKRIGFSVKENAKTVSIYKIDSYIITVKRDANTEAYSISIRLKAKGTLTGTVDTDGVIASPYANGAVPF